MRIIHLSAVDMGYLLLSNGPLNQLGQEAEARCGTVILSSLLGSKAFFIGRGDNSFF